MSGLGLSEKNSRVLEEVEFFISESLLCRDQGPDLEG